MEAQYSGDFLASLVEVIQNISHNHLNYLNLEDSIEINGYISVEIDNVKKERYVLSELLQSSGNVVSESFHVKSDKRFAGNPGQTKTSSVIQTSLVKRCSGTEEASASQLSKRTKYSDIIQIDDDYQPLSNKEQPFRKTSSQLGHKIQKEQPLPHSSHSHQYVQKEKPVDQYSSQSGQQIQNERPMTHSSQSHQYVQKEKPVDQYSSQSGQQIQKEQPMTHSSQSHFEREKPVHRYSSKSSQQTQVESLPVVQYSSQSQHVQREKPVHQYSSWSGKQIKREAPMEQHSPQSYQREQCQERELSTKAKSRRRSNASKSVDRRAMSQETSDQVQQYYSSQMNLSSMEHKFSHGSIPNERLDDALQYSDDALTGNGSDLSGQLENMHDAAYSAVHSETPGSFPSQNNEDNSSSLEVQPCVKIENADEDFNNEVIDVDLFEDLDDDVSPMHESYSMAENRPAPDTGLGQKQSGVSPGTNYVIRSAVTQFKRFFLDTYSQDIDMFSLSSQELDASLLEFYQGVRKKNGEKPSARSLVNMHSHFSMYLRDGGSPFFITKDEAFRSCRNYIKSSKDELGRQQKIQKFVPVDDSDVEQLFQTHQLGDHSHEAILNTVWFINSKYLGIKRPMDHLNLKWGDINLKTNKQGLEFLERVMSDVFSFKIHAKPTNPARCFVNIYKQYQNARPPISLEAQSPFYLKCSTGCRYFLSDAMTWGRHCSIWKRMIIGGQLDINKRITC